MKRKKLLYISFVMFFLASTFFTLFFLNYKGVFDKKSELADVNIFSGDLDLENINSYDEEYIKARVEVMKKRLKLKDIISKGDSYFENEKLGLALIQYKIALNKNPNDYTLIEKIGDILFELKNFKNSSIYYKELLKVKSFDKDKYVLSLMYSDFQNNILTFNDSITEIKTNITDKELNFYYINSLTCMTDFHTCKKNFDNYFLNINPNPTNPKLLEIKNTITNYDNFGLVDIYYKNTMLIGAFMKLKLYPLSIKLGKDLLSQKPGYKAILQIVSQSYFELGDYNNSSKYLKQYFTLAPNDGNAAYMLGIIALKLGDYLPSNIFFTKALNLGYTNSLNVKRKIAYNYFMLNDNEKMYGEFEKILDTEKGVSKDDINIMINTALETGNKSYVYTFAKKGLDLYNDEPVFYAYVGKTELEKGNTAIANMYVKKGLELTSKNQFLNYIYGLLKIKENKLSDAKEILSSALNLDKKSNIAREIENELANIDDGKYNLN